MAQIELTDSALVVHITGVDRFLALRSRLEVPLEHVAAVRDRVPEAREVWHGLRMGGTNLPGVITAGLFLDRGEWSFWDVRDPDRVIEIRLHDEGYARLVIGVDDPSAVAASITQRLQERS